MFERSGGYLIPASFNMLLSVPIGISALCLGTGNSFSVFSLYQMSCRLPLRFIRQLFFLSSFISSCVFMAPPLYSYIIARTNTCVNGRIYIFTRINYSCGFYVAGTGTFCYLLNSSISPAVMIPAGMATTAIPKSEEIIATTRPMVVTGYISP